MKKSILKIGNALNKSEQKEINGGRVPSLKFCCGGTGGIVVAHFHCAIGSYGTDLCNGQCWACY
ncbi:hypothetical protein [uncultured Tenacibaculum sp.]|uniref:hypothetical protein n=1 Tax=uncultured Tenacibaculum sp. TaxID=174713 RepID=UPI002638321C|nr:hypothetical protein [uncultured Tenacibaculum sp.]